MKPHGALYNAVVHDREQAAAVVAAVLALDPTLPLVGMPGSVVLELAAEAGLTTVTEAFADRAYTPEGTLVPRREPGAVLHDADDVVARCVRHGHGRGSRPSTARCTVLDVDSVCVHGDTPGAVAHRPGGPGRRWRTPGSRVAAFA